ncbi:MAG TPA: hypothetical protein VFF03_09430 [Rhodocyclaceae bacterium]|nr:hypothetical protein [Rhodocyclaceae bacterium]
MNSVHNVHEYLRGLQVFVLLEVAMARREPAEMRSLDQRAKELIDEFFGGRGRFAELEKQSGIPLNRWKNFVYGKQRASQEMIDFLCKSYPEESDWLQTGAEHPDQASFPFLAAVPKKWEGQTMGDRLAWVIKEWASPRGAELFQYLENRSRGKVTADEWAQLMLGTRQPTLEMVLLVVQNRPQFLEWVIRGRVSGDYQVDPTDRHSVEEWRHFQIWKEKGKREPLPSPKEETKRAFEAYRQSQAQRSNSGKNDD